MAARTQRADGAGSARTSEGGRARHRRRARRHLESPRRAFGKAPAPPASAACVRSGVAPCVRGVRCGGGGVAGSSGARVAKIRGGGGTKCRPCRTALSQTTQTPENHQNRNTCPAALPFRRLPSVSVRVSVEQTRCARRDIDARHSVIHSRSLHSCHPPPRPSLPLTPRPAHHRRAPSPLCRPLRGSRRHQ